MTRVLTGIRRGLRMVPSNEQDTNIAKEAIAFVPVVSSPVTHSADGRPLFHTGDAIARVGRAASGLCRRAPLAFSQSPCRKKPRQNVFFPNCLELSLAQPKFRENSAFSFCAEVPNGAIWRIVPILVRFSDGSTNRDEPAQPGIFYKKVSCRVCTYPCLAAACHLGGIEMTVL